MEAQRVASYILTLAPGKKRLYYYCLFVMSDIIH